MIEGVIHDSLQGMRDQVSDFVLHSLRLHGFDYDQITEEIYLGSNMCCQYGFHQELLSKGVRADISLEDDRTDSPHGVDFYLWLPTKDHESPSPSALELGVQTLEFLAKKHVKTYIHCKNGHGRAATLYGAYLVKQGMTPEEAVQVMQAKRHSVMPTEAQMRALRIYKASLTLH